jgi:hypothetical protein
MPVDVIISDVQMAGPVTRLSVPQLSTTRELYHRGGVLTGVYLTNISAANDARVYLCDGREGIDNIMIPLYIPAQSSKEVKIGYCGIPFRIKLTLWIPAGEVIGAVFIRPND